MVGEERIELSLLAKHDFEYDKSFKTIVNQTLIQLLILVFELCLSFYYSKTTLL